MTAQPLPAELVAQLRKICGGTSVLTDSVSLLGYENDALGFHRSMPDGVVIPRSTGELEQVVRVCGHFQVPYTLRGAGTSLSGGPVAVQGGIVVHLSRLKNILEVNTRDLYCTVEPGVVLNRLNAELKPHGLFYPPDPSSGFSCTLGGNVAENAGGIRCFKYGVTANYVLGMQVVLPDGTVVQLGGPAGGLGPGMECDWRSVMVGSEGLLGAISKIWLRLKPIPEEVWTFFASFQHLEQAMQAILNLTRHPAVPVALEFMDNRIVQLVENSAFSVGLDTECCYVLAEFDGPADLLDSQSKTLAGVFSACGARDVQQTNRAHEREKLWKARKVFGGLLGQISPDIMSQDASVPTSKIGEVLTSFYAEADKAGIPAVSVVHAGDGNIHPNLLFKASLPEDIATIKLLGRSLMEKIVSCGGTITGEHGVGNDKMEYLSLVYSPQDIAFQQAILACFNPQHQLNPGKVFPGRAYQPQEKGIPAGGTPARNTSFTSAKTAEPFEPFYDPENSVICVSGAITGKALYHQTAPDGLFFPLCSAADTIPLAERMKRHPFASRSFRYGAFADNVLGMNFRIPHALVKVGSRTIKNAAGFDMVRFLCRSGSRFGRPELLVLRLRPLAPLRKHWTLAGSQENLEAFQLGFLHHPWSHAADLFDVYIDSRGCTVTLGFSYAPEQEPVLEHQLALFCKQYSLQAVRGSEVLQEDIDAPVTIKTTVSRVLALGSELVAGFGGTLHGYGGNGYVLFRPGGNTQTLSPDLLGYLGTVQREIAPLGGVVHAPGLANTRDPMEQGWERMLKQLWGA